MQGYFNRPGATSPPPEGWLHTGDVGYRDEDGFFFLVDRKKDMIIRGGENIYPREVEDVLEFAGVEGAAVIDRPHEVRGEEVHAVLVLAPGVELVSVEEHCRARLAKFKVPSTWEVIDELPRPPRARSTRSRCANECAPAPAPEPRGSSGARPRR